MPFEDSSAETIEGMKMHHRVSSFAESIAFFHGGQAELKNTHAAWLRVFSSTKHLIDWSVILSTVSQFLAESFWVSLSMRTHTSQLLIPPFFCCLLVDHHSPINTFEAW
jgi:hypothetical protein